MLECWHLALGADSNSRGHEQCLERCHEIICPSDDAMENTRKFVKVKLFGQNPVDEGWWVSQNMELLCSLQVQLI